MVVKKQYNTLNQEVLIWAFRKELLKKIGEKVATKQRNSFSGVAIRFHDAETARKLCQKAKLELNINDHELRRLPKNALEKQVIAWWLRTTTVIDRTWICQSLAMGHPSNVTRAVQAVRDSKSARIKKLKRKLTQIEG